MSFESEVTQLCSTLCNPMDWGKNPWDFPGKNTGVGRHVLLQGIFPTQGSNPGLLHCRQTIYCLSHQGFPAPGPLVLIKWMDDEKVDKYIILVLLSQVIWGDEKQPRCQCLSAPSSLLSKSNGSSLHPVSVEVLHTLPDNLWGYPQRGLYSPGSVSVQPASRLTLSAPVASILFLFFGPAWALPPLLPFCP